MQPRISCLLLSLVVAAGFQSASAFLSRYAISTCACNVRSSNHAVTALRLGPEVVTDILGSAATKLEQQRLTPSSFSFPEIPLAVYVAAAASPLIPAANLALKVQRSKQNRPIENMYPEASAATYELSDVTLMEFGEAALVRPLLKQTQLEYRPLQIAYDAKIHGFNAKVFHQKVDGKGAAVVLCKANGAWFGGYNPRGWASLGGSRPSRASFLFYQKPGLGPRKWQKLRVMGGGGMSCGNDLFDGGIYLGAEALVVPLNGANPRSVRSRLGTYFESGPENRGTLLPNAGVDTNLQELKVLTGVYKVNEDIPNSGGGVGLGPVLGIDNEKY